MTQLKALLYKDTKLATRQWVTTLFQILSPIFCILCIYELESLAKVQSDKQNIKPPFEIPFGGLYPINMPIDIVDMVDYGVVSCLKMNKYAFTDKADKQSIDFIDHFVGFQSSSGIRTSVCKIPKLTINSPYFNKTHAKTMDDIQDDIFDELKRYEGTRLDQIWKSLIPSDSYYLFDKVDHNKVSGTLMSNNLNLLTYHRANGQTLIAFKNFPVS